ncbi:MAG: hypothetical protein ACOZCL_08825 [Bacillota bacterium]
MPWVISFIVSWLVFMLLVDKSKLKLNIYGGIITLTLATIVDWGGQRLGLYEFYNPIILWFGCSIFYKFGPIFTMGILFAQSVPKKRYLQVLNIFVFTLLYISEEYTIISVGAAKYIHWHIIGSILVNILAFTSLTWFTNTFLRRA